MNSGKKFNNLARRPIPTGDPYIPPEVGEAKCIRGLIIQKSKGRTGSVSDGYGLNLGPDGVDYEDEEVASINQAEDGDLSEYFMVRSLVTGLL